MARAKASTYTQYKRTLINFKNITPTLQSLIKIVSMNEKYDAITMKYNIRGYRNKYVFEPVNIHKHKLEANEIFVYIKTFADKNKYNSSKLLEIINDKYGSFTYVNKIFIERLQKLITSYDEGDKNTFFENNKEQCIELIKSEVIKTDSKDKYIANRLYSYLFNKVFLLDVNYKEIEEYCIQENIKDSNFDKKLISKTNSKTVKQNVFLKNKYDVVFDEIDTHITFIQMDIEEIYYDYKMEIEDEVNELYSQYKIDIEDLDNREKLKDENQILLENYNLGSGGYDEEKLDITEAFQNEISKIVEDCREKFYLILEETYSQYMETVYLLIKSIIIQFYKIDIQHIISKNIRFKTTALKNIRDNTELAEVIYLNEFLKNYSNSLLNISKNKLTTFQLKIELVDTNDNLYDYYIDDLVNTSYPDILLDDINNFYSKRHIETLLNNYDIEVRDIKALTNDNINYSDIDVILFYKYKDFDAFILLYIAKYNKIHLNYTKQEIIDTLYNNIDFIKEHKHKLTQTQINKLFL